MCALLLPAAEGPLVPDHSLARGLGDADRLALEAISRQPAALHPLILAVVERGETLVRLPAIWSDFEVAVAPIVAGYSEGERTALQDLLRHPGLLDALVEVGPDDAPLQARLQAFPEAVRATALVAGRDHHALLVALSGPVERAEEAFERALSGLPAETQEAFRRVAGEPDLAALLLEHMEASESLAGAYRIDPAATLSQLRDLSRQVEDELARREAQRQREEEAAMRRADRKAEERRKREARRRAWRYWGGYSHWGSSCWYGDPWYDHYYGTAWRGSWSRCWYPWNRYRRVWW